MSDLVVTDPAEQKLISKYRECLGHSLKDVNQGSSVTRSFSFPLRDGSDRQIDISVGTRISSLSVSKNVVTRGRQATIAQE